MLITAEQQLIKTRNLKHTTFRDAVVIAPEKLGYRFRSSELIFPMNGIVVTQKTNLSQVEEVDLSY